MTHSKKRLSVQWWNPIKKHKRDYRGTSGHIVYKNWQFKYSRTINKPWKVLIGYEWTMELSLCLVTIQLSGWEGQNEVLTILFSLFKPLIYLYSRDYYWGVEKGNCLIRLIFFLEISEFDMVSWRLIPIAFLSMWTLSILQLENARWSKISSTDLEVFQKSLCVGNH